MDLALGREITYNRSSRRRAAVPSAKVAANESNRMTSTVYSPHISTDDEIELERIIRDLAARRKSADPDSAEYKMIMRQMAGIRREGELAALILEEYDYWG